MNTKNLPAKPTVTPRSDGRFDVRIRAVDNAMTPGELLVLRDAINAVILPRCETCNDTPVIRLTGVYCEAHTRLKISNELRDGACDLDGAQ